MLELHATPTSSQAREQAERDAEIERASSFAGPLEVARRYRDTLVDYEGVQVTLADAVALDRDKLLYGNAYIRRLPGGRGERIPPDKIQAAP